MDSFSHSVLNVVGGYVFLKGAGLRFKTWHLFLLLPLSMLMDLDHVLSYYRLEPFRQQFLGSLPSPMHNIFLILTVCTALYAFMSLFSRQSRHTYTLALMVMMFGSLIFDMVGGMYGVPLFFPLSEKLYQIPSWWRFFPVGHSYAIEPLGIALFIYFSVVGLSAALVRRLVDESRGC